MIRSSVSNCPVPTEQQPLNEYEQLRTSWLFSDCALNWRQHITKMLMLWSFSWIIAGPVAAASFPPHKQIGQFLLCGAAGASIGVILLLVRLYLGWYYVSDRLTSRAVFYEESGWYDGQTWIKPEEILNRDRLIATYEIKPILRRLQLTFAGLAGMFVAGSIVWHLL
ncbi:MULTISPECIES: CGLD27 family protein [Calothrix]|uniref:CGLD27 family protein n=2 Tax=Calothrix TaxID=1186 RepID=A0ABR8AC84_9CYAN|nr:MULTISPECIES: CGLD27 family protein [Calothrix]MBD2196631.1 CGLD27 family protein [Calothrix parietina FACHB-288]MBD2224272.1 CGLD27 family protein [Calothrix anomala FACHB-343]